MKFSESFLADSLDVMSQLSVEDIEKTVEVLTATRQRNGRLFLAGSGGGAGHASHATCDFRKLCHMESYCVTDNVSELSARVNDDGWDTAYSNWLRASRLANKDCLFVFSVGGGSIEPPVSTNLVNSIKYAKEVGASVVGVVGRDGGALRRYADASVLIPTGAKEFVTPQAEGLQAVIWHLIVSHPLLSAASAKWEGLDTNSNPNR